MIKRLWYSLLSNDKPQDKNVIWIDTSNSESFTLKLYRNGGWKPLQVVGTSRDMIERELTGYVTSHYHSYDRIINKPTTLEGYGIIDCFNKKEVEKLLDNKVTKVDGMSLTSNNFSDKYKKMLDDLSTSYYNKKNVDNLLNEKQDVISDLESIREGAKKGSTALQSFTETDPIYLKDKPFIALKSDLLNDNNFVHKEGDEDIKGIKRFEHIGTNNFGIYQEDNNNHSVYIDYHYDESNYLPILHFGSEEDWLTILDNIADPVDDFHAANKHYVDTKILTTEENLVHKDGFERITGRKQFQNGINVGLFNALVANEDGVQSGAWLDQNENPAPFIVADPTADDHAATKLYVDGGLATKQDTLTDTDGSYGQRVAELETGKQDTLTAGNGIIIEQNVISAIGGSGGGGSVDLSEYAKTVDVNAGLATKQDKISDLATIREGAAKGATALQSETDPIYSADKPSLALKSEIPDISGKADKTAIVTETEGNSSYRIAPNRLTRLGTLASNVTLSLNTASEEAGVANVYDIIFSTPAAAPSITWPEGITWIGGSAPAIAGGKTYEVSIMDNLATYGEY